MSKARVYNAINSWPDESDQDTAETPVIAIELGIEDPNSLYLSKKRRCLLTLSVAAELRDYLTATLDCVYTEQIADNLALTKQLVEERLAEKKK